MSRPKIAGGAATRQTFLPFSAPWLGEEEIALRSDWLTTSRVTFQFEEAFSRYIGAPHSLAFNSCTGGLHTALAAMGIGPGDEVITSDWTFTATANVIVHQRATPVLVDVDPYTLNIDLRQVEAKITPRTRVLIPVHFGGRPCPMDEILALARKYGLSVVEDAAHAFGACYKGKMVGNLGSQVSCFSFYPTKCITTGEGGMNTTADEELARRMSIWRLHGINRDAWDRYQKGGSWFYEVVEPGFKYNLTDIASAIGLAQLQKTESFQVRREVLVNQYRKKLAGLPLDLPPEFPDGRSAWHLFPIQLRLEELRCTRSEMIEALVQENVGVSVHFIPLHRMPYYRDHLGLRPEDFPVAEEAFQRLLSLPLFARMSDEDQDSVVEALSKLCTWYSRS
jgi:dTDP-4-amino-4,6-dideoxygalactose transaminase